MITQEAIKVTTTVLTILLSVTAYITVMLPTIGTI